MFEVLSIAEDENAAAGDLEEVIMRDQALSAKILKVSNSAYYGIPRTVETVSRATVLLGFQTVVGLALTVSVYDTLWGAGKGHYLDRRELWKHSLGVATAARLLADNGQKQEGSIAFTLGMLHDIGKSVFDTNMPEEYSKVIDACHKDQMQFHEAESMILGVTHADLGFKVAQRWQLPEALCEGIRCHHTPADSPKEFERSSVLANLGDYLARHSGIGEPANMVAPELDAEVLSMWGGGEERFSKAAAELEECREKIDQLQP